MESTIVAVLASLKFLAIDDTYAKPSVKSNTDEEISIIK